MILFNPADPFPLLPLGSYTYAMAKEHALSVDEWIGFDIPAIERKLQRPTSGSSSEDTDVPQEMWIGLDAQSFLTPYIEIRSMLELLNPQNGERVIDLGCGYGRMAHVMGRHYPSVSFLGYEIVSERVSEARRCLSRFNYPQSRISERDLAHSKPEPAHHYFMYDYGSKAAIEKTLQDLKLISREQSFQLIARGRASRHFILQNHPWLSEVHTPRHFDTFSIFQS